MICLGCIPPYLPKEEPWTTVHGNYPGTLDDVLQLSDVKLVYLGQDRFATLWRKVSPNEPSLRERNYNYTPMLPLALPPTSIEMETAETLVNMQQGPPLTDTSANMPHPPEFDSPNVSPTADAMDKITDRYDFNPTGRPLNRDAMDQVIGLDALVITNVRSLAVETDQPASNMEINADLCVGTTDLPSPGETDPTKEKELCVETSKFAIKECSVKLHSLESILFPKRKSGRKIRNKDKTQEDTTQPKPTPMPQQTQSDLTIDTVDKTDVKPTPTARDSVPPIRNPPQVDQSEMPSKPLKRAKKYGCRMCEVRVDTAVELKTHHISSHGIMYCKLCTKAFNNQLSLTRHEYEHKTRPYVCNTCAEDFPFESQYKTHKLTHSERRKHACSYKNCDKHFKNLGDKNRHVKKHTSPWLRCPDCPDYKTKSKRDLDSHWLSHSNIERYFCESCGKGFVYNTQKIRHHIKKLCKKA